ncbi:MAG: type II and III secretion system protein family protein [Rhizobiaceae bacterium]|nr:type II and III secretion system protein family protein [Rhizobiaceae bacterium]
MNKHQNQRSYRSKFVNLLLAAAFASTTLAGVPALSTKAYAANIVHLSASTRTKTIKIARALPKTIRTDASFSEIVVGDPEILVVKPLTDRSFYLIGSKVGSTGIALYNEEKQLVGMMDVQVGANTESLNQTLRSALPKSRIRAKTANGRVVLTGQAKSSVAAAKARRIAKQFDKDIIDSISVAGSQQVKLEVRFIEAQRSKTKSLGLGVSGTDGRTTFGTNSGTLFTSGSSLVSGAVPFGRLVGNLIDQGMRVDFLIDALESRGVARRLAEPNLVALSGDTASFLAGGEFPIPISDGDGKVTVEFKKFGVGLEFTPTVLDNGLIHLKIAPEVSEVDPTTSVKFGGIEIPGLVVRRAETTVELRDGQSFVIAGLLQSTSNYTLRKFPWLGDLPIIGALFRSSSFRKKQTDLVIIVTPRLVRPIAAGTLIETPLTSTLPGNDVDLFVNGKLEVSRAHLRKIAAADSGTLRSGHVISLD